MGIPASVLDTISLVVVTIILSYFTLVFGELVPKRIAMQKSMEMARLSCHVVSAIATIAKPVVKLLSLSTNRGAPPAAHEDRCGGGAGHRG